MEGLTPEQAATGHRIRFDVSGVMFAVDESKLKPGSCTKLTQLCESRKTSGTDDVIVIDRPADSFGAILAWYQTGELHIPKTTCPGAFLKEMEFWEISLRCLANCCFLKLQRHLEEQNTLTNFRRDLLPEPNAGRKLLPCSSVASLTARIWSVVDNHGYTFPSKVYLFITLVVIGVSIMTTSLATCDTYRRNMTNCERIEFMRATKMEHAKEFAAWIGAEDCDNTTLPFIDQWGITDFGGQNAYGFETNYEYVNVPDLRSNTTQSPSSSVISVKVPTMKIPIQNLIILEYLTLTFFTIDFAIRLLTCPSIGSYFKSVINIVDAIALIFTYFYLLVSQIDEQVRYKGTSFDMLGLMVMLRSVRLFRIVRNLTAARVLVYTLNQNLKELFIVFLFLVAGVSIFSSAVYITESNSAVNMFENIPAGWYWAVITMTTVGYGDIRPVTEHGRFIAGLCAMSGVIMFALTVPIFAKNFHTLYQYAGMKCFKVKSYKHQRYVRPQSHDFETTGLGSTTQSSSEELRLTSTGTQREGLPTLTDSRSP